MGEYDSTGSVKKAYAWMPNSTWGTAPVLMVENGQTYYYHNDHLGTPMKLTDESGAIVWSAKYSAFGQAFVDTNSTIENNLRFPGQYYDAETGLHYNYHRYYNPQTGRYTQKDPIGFAGGDANLYRYVRNGPVNGVDPWGNLAFFWHFATTFAVGISTDNGALDSFVVAFQTAWVDFESGSQDTKPENTRKHAMAGEVSPGKFQTPEQAIKATEDYIESSINNGNIADAIHAAQDLVTPAHAGSQWHGLHFDWETFEHITADINPTFETHSDAFEATRDVFRKRKKKKGGCL